MAAKTPGAGPNVGVATVIEAAVQALGVAVITEIAAALQAKLVLP